MKIDPNAPAYPVPGADTIEASETRIFGLTIRAEIASRALQGLLANPNVYEASCPFEQIANEALEYTDALIARLNDE